MMVGDMAVYKQASSRIELRDQFDRTLLVLDVMDTHELRVQGLQGRASLEPNAGLLFPTHYGAGYHMCHVNFAIDIAYLDKHGNVMEVHTIEPEIGRSWSPAGAVWAVESNSGFWKNVGVGIGHQLFLSGA